MTGELKQKTHRNAKHSGVLFSHNCRWVIELVMELPAKGLRSLSRTNKLSGLVDKHWHWGLPRSMSPGSKKKKSPILSWDPNFGVDWNKWTSQGSRFSFRRSEFLMVVVINSISHVWIFVNPWTASCEVSCPLLSPRDCSHSGPLSWWCHPTISSSVTPFSSCPQISQNQDLFQRVSPSHQVAKVLELSSEDSGLISFRIDWFDLVAVQGTLKVFSSTTIWKHQFFGAQPSLWSSSHIHTWLLEKP